MLCKPKDYSKGKQDGLIIKLVIILFIPKYRKKILVGGVRKALKGLLYECSEKHGLSIISVETDIDHVHVFVSAPPRYSPAWIANLMKGYSSRMLRL